ncbi:hypothetical protein PFLUV_G00146690 [Perca fluviatilis]|uniref:Uncharacterized protein n=1 Tax=Perca fluviatilis TaxID=8168 RepID=A0A6A5EWH9_PERFL|nr:hypothetical protein PFLUV_G00146690 [Perca fluviatilis]
MLVCLDTRCENCLSRCSLHPEISLSKDEGQDNKRNLLLICSWKHACSVRVCAALFSSPRLPASYRSRGERCSWQEGGERETKPSLLGNVVVRLFWVVGGAASPGSSQRDAGPGSYLLGSLPYRQPAGLR